MNNGEKIEQAECEFADWAQRCHRSGLTFWTILSVVLYALPKIMMQVEAEQYLKQKT